MSITENNNVFSKGTILSLVYQLVCVPFVYPFLLFLGGGQVVVR